MTTGVSRDVTIERTGEEIGAASGEVLTIVVREEDSVVKRLDQQLMTGKSVSNSFTLTHFTILNHFAVKLVGIA